MQNQSKPRVALKAVTLEHLLLTTLLTAGTATIDAAVQYIQSNGAHFSATQLVGVTLTGFLVALSAGVVSLEKSPDVQQAIDGAITPHIQALSSLITQHASLANEMTNALVWLNEQVQQQKVPAGAVPIVPGQPVQVTIPVNATSAIPQSSFVANMPPVYSTPQATAPQNPIIRHFGDSQVVPVPPAQRL